MITEKDLECEMEELRLEIKENTERMDKLCDILKQNNTKLRTIKEMTNQTPCNYRTPPKYNVEYLDDKMVIVNGVQYQKVEKPKPQTLLDIILDWWVQDWTGDSEEICKQLVDAIERWLPNPMFEDGEDYNVGWNDCLQKIEENLK